MRIVCTAKGEEREKNQMGPRVCQVASKGEGREKQSDKVRCTSGNGVLNVKVGARYCL